MKALKVLVFGAGAIGFGVMAGMVWIVPPVSFYEGIGMTVVSACHAGLFVLYTALTCRAANAPSPAARNT